jgi:hypothetical protein
MKRLACLSLLSMLFFSLTTFAQEKKEPGEKEKILAEGDPVNVFNKKIRWGLSYSQYWGTFKGKDLAETYFAKPLVGFNFRAEYYPLSFVGIGAGFGFQQQGAGVKHQDNYGGAFSHPWVQPSGDIDSTYINKIRFNTWEMPITLLLRTPKDVIKGIRLSGAAGVVLVHSYHSNDVWLDVAGGAHLDHFVTNDYSKNSMSYQFSFGPDINAGEGCVFQVHLVYAHGMRNVYAAGQGDARQVTYGIRVAWLF